MSNVALYTFGLLNPAATSRMAEFGALGQNVYAAVDQAPGLLDRAGRTGSEAAEHVSGTDFGRWGIYTLPLDLPDFAGHDPNLHIATLSVWRDFDGTRRFVNDGLHREALRRRHDWFLRGPWPGHVLWHVDDHAILGWSDGVGRFVARVRDAETPDHFTFGSR